jgi:hypothetical protein
MFQTGGTREKITLGMMDMLSLEAAIAHAKTLFPGVQGRYPDVVGFRIFDNEGNEVAHWATHA